VQVIDSIAWVRDHLLARLDGVRRRPSIAVHPSCAARHMGLTGPLADAASTLADEVVVPVAATCCGFAGDRGFLHPELTASATAPAAREIEGRHFDAYVCSNRTCEIGLEQATGAAFLSIVQVLEEATRPA
jgi:D-lactate dehydrogenase